MILEINLVKVDTAGSSRGKLLERKRYSADDDAQMLDRTVEFIKDNLEMFISSIRDRVFVESIRNLRHLTIQELFEFKYILASKYGMDLWIQFVADVEVNSEDVPDSAFEFNVVDRTNLIGVTPFATKIIQLSKEVSFTDIYTKIQQMYALFKEPLFNSISNPIEGVVRAMKEDEDLVGRVPVNRTAYVNSVIEMLGKELKVITN